MNLEPALRAAAIVQLAIAITNVFLVRIMRWQADVARMSQLVREVFNVHSFFITFTVAAFAVLTWRFAGEFSSGATPLHGCRAPLDGGPELGLEFRQALANSGGLLFEQLLRIVAFGEIQWRPKVRRRHTDDPSAKPLGDISGYRQAGIIRSVQRQTDQDSLVVHDLLHTLR